MYIVLDNNITNTNKESSIHVSGKTVTVDLMGHTVDVNRKNESSGADYHFMYAQNNATLTVKDSYGGGTVKNGNVNDGGGAFDTDETNATLNLYNITMTDNKSTGSEGDGGAVRNRANLNIDGCVIKNNSAGDDGGAIMVYNGADSCTIKNTVIAGNTSSSEGGAINHTQCGSTTAIENTFIVNNTATSDCGGIDVRDGTVNMTGGALIGNSAKEGGAVYVEEGKTFTADGTAFIGNEATNGSGGAIASFGTAELEDCFVSGNTASQRGGALYNGNNANDAALTDTVLQNNSANYGGAVYINTATVSMSGCTVTGNKSNNSGGAVFSDSNADHSLIAESTLFKGNSARTNGGAINALTNIWLTDCTITGNTATYSGRGVCIYDTMDISGGNVISGNGTDNVYLATNSNDSSKKGTINRRISIYDQTQIGVKADDYDRILVFGLANESEGDYFVLDDTGSDSYELTKSCVKLPTTSTYVVSVKKTDKVSVNSWQGLQDAINDGDCAKVITLSDNITANSNQTRIEISNGDDITIDLNGKMLSRARTSKDTDGHVIEVHSGGVLTVRDSSTEQTGKITGGWANNGGGINIGDGGTLTLESGTISGNKAENGGGVYVHDSATFKMTGGSIASNTASSEGGGIDAENSATLTGGEITDNKAKYGGGIYYDEGGETLNLKGVTVSKNNATEKGGGIYIWHGTVSLSEGGVVDRNTAKNGGGVFVTDDCAFTASNATFTKNKATDNGGAIYNDENLTLTSCTFTENEAENNGGGVYNCDNAELTNCTFTQNKTINGAGGAINQHDGSMLLDGGTITENTAAYRGGVYVDEESDNEKFQIKGALNITNNESTDIYLDEEEVIKIVGELSENARIGISLERSSGTFTKGFNSFHNGEDPATYFTADKSYSVMADSNGEAMIIESDWTLLKKEIEGAADNSTVTLDRDWKAIEDDKTILIAADKHLTLDFNGHTIDANKSISTSIFDVKGTLTVKDSSAGQKGKITGGNCTRGGAIYIFSGAVMNLQSGSITGNTAAQDGGGIYINANGTLNISGGNVSDNSARFGAGIYNRGTATVSGGTITGNAASENGGGICNCATLNIQGGSITENVAVKHAGGVYIRNESGSVLNVKEEPVIENNQSPIGNNILLCGGKTITITDSLYPTAKLDVVVENTAAPITNGYASHNRPGVFTYNGKIGLMEEKDGELYLKQVTGDTYVDSWTALQDAINNSSEGDVIVLTADAVCTNNTRLNVENKTVTIELNGHTIDRNRKSGTGNGQVFGVTGTSHLTITDVAGTGTITGGFSSNGGGIFIDTNATVAINGGSIQGNTSDSSDGGDGGGVYNKGTLIMNGGAIAFNKADDTGGGIYCTDSGTIQLDNALITGNYADDDNGGGMNLHLKDNNSYIKNSTITNNLCGDHHGGAIRMDAKGKTLLIETTHIEGNTASDNGGGIYITEGKIEINDSFVNKNTAGNDGGAVYGEDGTTLIAVNTEFNMNTAAGDGGAIKFHDLMTLTSCKVNENVTEDSGGAIYYDDSDHTLELTDTEVNSNMSIGGQGGAIKVHEGSLTITRGSVSENRTESGAGSAIYFDGQKLNTERVTFESNFNNSKYATIYLRTGEAHIKGGSFKNNFAKYDGGGVYVTKNTKLYVEEATYEEDGVQKTEPVTFESNHADRRGSAIFLCDDGSLYLRAISATNNYSDTGAIHADEDFYISGYIYIPSQENNGCGLYMEDDDDKVHIDGELAEGSHINVKQEYETGSFTKGFKKFHDGADPLTYFSAQEGYAIALDGDGEVKVKGTDWFTLQQAIDNAQSGDTITLAKDYEADDADSSLVIPGGKTLTLDLHGCKLNGSNEIKGGTVLKVENGANLTIEDNYVFPNNVEEEYRESFEGAITGGTASAIVNRGTLTIKGGKIQNNKGGIGGGINNYGTLTITGGRIKANAATEEGGGIHNSGTLNLYGGEIKNNTSASSGGGIFCAQNSRIYVKDAPKVIENNGAAGKNIVLSSGVKITLNDFLDMEAKLDVALKNYEQAITSGYAANGSPQGVFTYNENNDIILAERDGELYFPYTINVDEWVGSWVELQQVIDTYDDMPVSIGLSADLTPTGQQRILVEDGRDITIELAGHTMNRGFTSKQDEGNVFKVTDNDTQLTIKDTLGTGTIRGGYANGDGGGFYVVNHALLTIESGTVCGNGASSDGGGIYVDNAELVMTGGAVSGNISDDTAGGIYNSSSAKITLTNADITLNTSENRGGGMNLHMASDSTFTDCNISFNTTKDSDGGGIVMNASGKTLTLNNCKVNNNNADDEGGGIYIDAGTVTATGDKCQINNNTSEDGGGVYISSGDTFKLTNKAAIANNTTTKYSGGGITCHGDLEINNASVALNHSAKYGGGIFYQHSGHEITLTKAEILGNEAGNDGGGLYIRQGEVELSGGKIKGNTSPNGGGVFVTDDADFTAKNGTEIIENISNSEDGGGIVNKGETTLDGVTVKDNTAKNNGGGIRNDGKLTVEDSTIDGNKATLGCGGGIAHMGGTVWLKGADVIQNNQAIYGGGIYVEEEADKFYVEDAPVVTENSGSNVYLYKEYICLNGALMTGARISVSTSADTGKFTKDFTEMNGNAQPSEFFVSDYGYTVYLDVGEAALKWEVVEDPNPFIDRNNNMIESTKVSGRNWMSAVSGERKLNEINVIRANDAAMNNVEANNTSGDAAFRTLVGDSAAGGGVLLTWFAIASCTVGPLMLSGLVIAAGVLGSVSMLISQICQSITEAQAKTQYHYIDEMMDMGVRVFDLRVNNKNREELDAGDDYDDNVNLWQCHGDNTVGGCIYGCDHDGNVLSVNKTLEWAKEFLKKNPTEVLYFEYSPETQDNDTYDTVLADRLYKILKNFSYEINPSTGKPYLYMEDGVFGKDYTYWPKLKDVRGQIVYMYSNATDESRRVGGYSWAMNGTSPDYGRAVVSNDTVNTPLERIGQIEAAAAEHPSPNILTDALVHRNINSGYYVNMTDDSNAAVDWFTGKQADMTKTPLELEEKVLYGDGAYVDYRNTTVFYEMHKAFGTADWYDPEYEPGYTGILREGGIINQKGEYYGIFSFDGVTEKEAKMCWSSNFYNDLEYCTVTVKSGLADDDTVKTYKVLKGTAITIPNCIYEKPSTGTAYFQNWHAVTGDNNVWTPSYSLQDDLGTDYTGRDNRAWLMEQSYEEQIDPATQIPQNSERDVMPGDTVTIMDNTEFTAVWGNDVKAPVTVVWNDGEDGDGLRTDRLELSYQVDGIAGTNTVTVEEDSNWSTMLTGDVLSNTITVNWNRINVTTQNPHGEPIGGYCYAVTGNVDTGFTVTMQHAPQTTVTPAGVVLWDDNNDARQIRPDSVTIKLIKNGDEDNPINTMQVTEADGWAYDFGTFPAYTEVTDENGNVSYQRDVYSITEEPFKCYTASYDDFNVTNVFVDPDIGDVIVEIDWKDAYNSYGERPETVTLHLWDGDTEIDSQVVSVDDEAASTFTAFDIEKYELKHLGDAFNYRVELDGIPNYTPEYEPMEGNTLVVVNTYDNTGKYFKGHSLSLNGDIGVNFFVKLTSEDLAKNPKVHFEWFDKTLDVKITGDMFDTDTGFYKVSCPVAVAEMTYNVNATLKTNGAEVEKDRYSVVKYANVIMSNKDFYDNYIAKMTAELGDNEKAKQKFYDLLMVVTTMLDYGAKAQLAFDRNTDNLANGGVSFFTDDVTSDMIDSKSSDMTGGLKSYGLEYQYSTVVFLSKTSLRHYYKITDETLFNAVKDGITFDGQSVQPVKRGDMIYFEKQSISASRLDTQYILTIGDNQYKYSAMDYTKRLINSDNDKTFIELAKATYRFNQAANTYFGD